MAKKCPPGVICIENMTIVFLLLFVFLIVTYLFYIMDKRETNKDVKNERMNKIIYVKERKNLRNDETYTPSLFPKPQTMMTNQPNLFLNPYTPPLKDNRFYHTMMSGDPRETYSYPLDGQYHHQQHNQYHQPRHIPINVPTSHYDLDYRQVGILTRENGRETILPIFGRPLHSNRNKWQYYTMTDKNNFIKLPVSHKGRSCTNEYGCDEIFSGDVIYVEGYKDAFKVTIYENNRPRYIPHL